MSLAFKKAPSYRVSAGLYVTSAARPLSREAASPNNDDLPFKQIALVDETSGKSVDRMLSKLCSTGPMGSVQRASSVESYRSPRSCRLSIRFPLLFPARCAIAVAER